MILPASVPPETSAFLGLVAVCMVGLLVLYLYLSKKVCFSNLGNFPCCDEPIKTEKCKITRQLGSSYGYDDVEESSSDSEKEVLERLYQPGFEAKGPRRQSSLNKKHRQQLTRKPSNKNLNHHHNNKKNHNCWSNNEKKERKHLVRQSTSSDKLLERGDSINSEKSDPSSLYQESLNCRSSFDQVNNNQQYEGDQTSEIIRQNGLNSKESGNKIDLISMAEKGKIGKTGSLDGTSSSSDSASQDTEEEALIPILHEKAKQKAAELLRNSCGTNGLTKSNSGRMNKKSYNNSGYERRSEADSETNSKSSDNNNDYVMINNGNDSVKYGCLQISHAYDPPSRKLHVTVIRGRSVPTQEKSGSKFVYVKVVLTPNHKSKQSTKPKPVGTGDPIFNETFTFNRIDPEDILNHGIRYRLYTRERMSRETMLGEGHIYFSHHKPLQQETRIWLTLEPRASINKADSRSDVSSIARSDSSGSNSESICSPELLLGLAYNGITGRLTTSIIRGSSLKTATMTKAPDTYVKVILVSSSGQEISRAKTSIKNGQPNPTYKETFSFPVALFQLPDVTLLVSVYCRKPPFRNEMIGWFSLGRNSTGEEEKSHWLDMRDVIREQVTSRLDHQIARWHVLCDP